jgi:DNA-binding PadR family transcriptional regulator
MERKIFQKYMPMTETAYYILLSLKGRRHGYSVMQHIEKLTKGRLKIGPGTVYTTLFKMERDGLIRVVREEARRKIYQQTSSGKELINLERQRLEELVRNGKEERVSNYENQKGI